MNLEDQVARFFPCEWPVICDPKSRERDPLSCPLPDHSSVCAAHYRERARRLAAAVRDEARREFELRAEICSWCRGLEPCQARIEGEVCVNGVRFKKAVDSQAGTSLEASAEVTRLQKVVDDLCEAHGRLIHAADEATLRRWLGDEQFEKSAAEAKAVCLRAIGSASEKEA